MIIHTVPRSISLPPILDNQHTLEMNNSTIGIDLNSLRRLLEITYRSFEIQGYFQKSFGLVCPDQPYDRGEAGLPIEEYLFLRLKRQVRWPLAEGINSYSERDVFDLIGLLTTVSAKPIQGWYHEYCGQTHYSEFNTDRGRLDFADAINESLALYGAGYQVIVDEKTSYVRALGISRRLREGPQASFGIPRFDDLYPNGLPVSLRVKPSAKTVRGEHGVKLEYLENEHVGVLRGDLLPNFSFDKLVQWLDPAIRLNHYSTPSVAFRGEGIDRECNFSQFSMLYNLCQTDCERLLMKRYIEKYVITYSRQMKDGTWRLKWADVDGKVPGLVPQVWIDWTSETRPGDRFPLYSEDNGPSRVDFVVVWNSQMTIIQVDDIGHYAIKHGDEWRADEVKYASQLLQDRKLQIEGWRILRVGNWEIRDSSRIDIVLEQMRQLVGFDPAPSPGYYSADEDIPF